jgi:hypothetical protein
MLSTALVQALEQLGEQDASIGQSNWQQLAALAHAAR